MIIGIGLDLIELQRVEQLVERSNRFYKKILSVREQVIFEQLTHKRKIEYLAGRFAAKEAYAKAIGTGIGENCTFHQIEILNNELGKPILYFNERLANGFVSITHTNSVAAAQVILESIE